jgi:hypothetical protein
MGVMPSQALPSYVSSSTDSGSSRRSSSAATGQWMNAVSTHDCAWNHGSSGTGHGRCSTWSSACA